MKHLFVLIGLGLACFPALRAQSIPSPEEFLGYPLGSQFTPHHRVVDYFEAVARTSSHAQLTHYGSSLEGRDLLYAVVTAETNQARLDTLRRNNLIRAGLAQGKVVGEQLPVVWLSYNVHGDEAVCSEAAMGCLYQLLTQAHMTAWLEDMIVIIDPCLNPDGRDRYVNWYKHATNLRPNASPLAWEHHQPWPGGRYNHYLFDLNRDWCWQSQLETRLRVRQYQRWMPQIHADFHEMGYHSPYFFAPAAEPYHPELTDWQLDFQHIMGANHAHYFDQKQWLYYTNEVFDLFYPSYGDTWPLFNGAQGFTYEQGGSGRAGRAVARKKGDTLLLSERLDHHLTTSYSTLEAAHQNRVRLVREYNAYFASAANPKTGEHVSYVIRSGTGSQATVQALAQLLDRNQIRFGYASAEQAGRRFNGFDYRKKEHGKKLSLLPGDLIVNTYQPQARLVRVLLEPDAELSDSLTYDLTAWSLPYAFNLEAYATKALIKPELSQWEDTLRLEPPESTPYALLVEWNDWQSARLLARLLQAGIRVRQASEGFSMQGKSYPAGSLIITAAENQADFASLASKLAKELNCPLQYQYAGLSDEGRDLGSGAQQLLSSPRVGLVGGADVAPAAFGAIWHFFEQELGYPLTLLQTDYLGEISLNEFDVLILPSGTYRSHRKQILSFARQGGRVIALDRALSTFGSEDPDEKNPYLAKCIKAAQKQRQHEAEALISQLEIDLDPYADRERNYLSNTVAGSIYRVRLDTTHPIAFGYAESVFFLKRNRTVYPLFQEEGNTVGYFDEDSHMAGFTGASIKKEVTNSLAIGVEKFGRGDIVYFTDAPVFRGFWRGGNLLLANAVFAVF
jgi:hypothetical protein